MYLPFFQIQFSIFQIACISGTKEAIGSESRFVYVLAMVVPRCNCWTFQQYFVVLANLYLQSFDGSAHRSHCKRLAAVVATNGGETFGEAISRKHVESYAVYKGLYFGRNVCTCRWKEVRIGEP